MSLIDNQLQYNVRITLPTETRFGFAYEWILQGKEINILINFFISIRIYYMRMLKSSDISSECRPK